MIKNIKCLTAFITLICVLLVFVPQSFAQETESYSNTKAQKFLLQLEKNLDRQQEAAEMDQSWQQINAIRLEAKTCVEENNIKLEKVGNELKLIGEPAKSEGNVVRTARRYLEKDKQSIEQAIAGCRFVLLKSEALQEQLSAQRTKQQKQTLINQQPGVWKIFTTKETFKSWSAWVVSILTWQGYGWQHLNVPGAIVLAVLLLIATLLSVFIGNRINGYIEKNFSPSDNVGKDTLAILCAIKRYRYGLLVFSLWSVFWVFIVWQENTYPLLAAIVFYAFALLLFLAVIRAFFNPAKPLKPHLKITEPEARRLGRNMALWGGLTFIGAVLNQLPIFENLSSLQIAVLRFIYMSIYITVLISMLWSVFSFGGRYRLEVIRAALSLVLVAALVFEILGYQNLSSYLVLGITLSFLLLLAGLIISRLAGDFYDSLDEGRYHWQQELRDFTGLNKTEAVPGLFWVRLITSVFIWSTVVLVLLGVWEVPYSKRAAMMSYITEGIQVGQLNIVPVKIFIAVVMLTVMLSVITWLKRQMDEHWLKKSRMDAGARNAIVSVSGYVIGALAIIIALGLSGVDMSNLAIIAGALSVGIGFGLQNIVNNFVSGLILLFERPIRKGDWIVVGNTEGYVEGISIRSTLIRTFDRADVIVPNSELISNQVTNWMLHDLRGRVKIPVGVAYGSDVEKVSKILLEIGRSHALAITDGSVTEPKVLFLGFGDSSLNFELRFYIRNVDERLNVISQVNYAIDKAFRENGVEIPFPQRDLHVRSVDKDVVKNYKSIDDNGNVGHD